MPPFPAKITAPKGQGGSLGRIALVLLTLATGLALTLAWWIERSHPVALPEAAARLPCVSYAPFRRPGESPFDPAAHVSPQRIEQDLRLLRPLTDCIRTYAVSQGLDAVLAVARRLGMRVRLGAWIGRDASANEAELRHAIALTREHADVIDVLIVGNEVLLRRELAPDALAALLARAKRESAVPVSYADVWEFWLRHAAVLSGHVGVVTVHVLPYWEDDPVAIESAVEHVYAIAARVKQRFAGLPVWVGETGWPAAGRQRSGAVPGRLERARFVRELVARAEREPLAFNLVEGFDQPWKRALEGAMGGAWGVLDSDGVGHFPWTGPVERDPQAWRGLLAAALGGAVGLVAGLLRWRVFAAAIVLGLAWATVASLAVAQGQAMVAWNRTPLEWAVSGVATLAALGASLLAAAAVASRLTGRNATATPGLARALFGPPSAGRVLAVARAALLFVAATLALQLVFDGRYREFAWPLVAAPALLLVALRFVGDRLDDDAREERLLALVAAVGAVAIVAVEGLHNAQAVGFAALLLALAGACGWPYRVRTNTSAASSAAGAARPAE